MRKVDVQPAPRMRMETEADERGEEEVGVGEVVSCVMFLW